MFSLMCFEESDGMLFEGRKCFVPVEENDGVNSVGYQPTSLYK